MKARPLRCLDCCGRINTWINGACLQILGCVSTGWTIISTRTHFAADSGNMDLFQLIRAGNNLPQGDVHKFIASINDRSAEK